MKNSSQDSGQPSAGVNLSLKLIIVMVIVGLGLIALVVANQPNRAIPREDRERLARLGQALLQYVEAHDGTYPFSLKPVIRADDRIVQEGWNRSVLDETVLGWANGYREGTVKIWPADRAFYPAMTTYFDSVLDLEDIKGLEKHALRVARTRCVHERMDGFAVMPSRCEWTSGPYMRTCNGHFLRLGYDGSVTQGKINTRFESKGLLNDLQSQTYSFDSLAFFTDACPVEDFMPKR